MERIRTAWIAEEPGLVEPDHPTRQAAEAAGLDRLVVLRRTIPTG